MSTPWNVDYATKCITYDGYGTSKDRIEEVMKSVNRQPDEGLFQLDMYLADRYVFEGEWTLKLRSVVLYTEADSLTVAGYIKRGMHLRIEHSSTTPPWVTSMVRNEVMADILYHIEDHDPREGQTFSLAPYIVCGEDADDLLVTLTKQGFVAIIEPEFEEERHPNPRIHDLMETLD